MNVPGEKKIMVTPAQAAQLFGVSEGSLAQLRCKGIGPRYFKVGRKVLYVVADLKAYFMGNPITTEITVGNELLER